MNNTFFLVLFIVAIYLDIRYFNKILVTKDEQEHLGFFHQLNFSRILFLIGIPILAFFIYDILRIQITADASYWLKGGLVIALTLIILIVCDKYFQKKNLKK